MGERERGFSLWFPLQLSSEVARVGVRCLREEGRVVSGARMPSVPLQPDVGRTGGTCMVRTALSQWVGVGGTHSRRKIKVGAASLWG